MKSLVKILTVLCCIFLLIVSCNNMDDIHQKYLDASGKIYLGKTDSLTAFDGFERVKLVWYTNADPKIETTVIFWNNRKDSIVKPFIRKQDGVQKDSVIIDKNMDGSPLAEGTYLFELVNKNERSEQSLTSTVQGRTYGELYESLLLNRSVKGAVFDNEEGILTIEWDTSGKTEIGIKLDYTDIDGNSQSIMINNSETETKVSNLKAGEPVQFSTIHKPDPTALDIFHAKMANVRYYASITDQKLKNTKAPLETGEFVFARFYTAVDWIANEVAAINGNVDIHELFDFGSLTLHAWWLGDGWPCEYFENGKLYQITELEAGSYRFEVFPMSYDGAKGRLYVAAALGSDIPDVDDLPVQALAYNVIPGVGMRSISFVLSEKSTVSLGFVAHMGTREHVAINRVELYKQF